MSTATITDATLELSASLEVAGSALMLAAGALKYQFHRDIPPAFYDINKIQATIRAAENALRNYREAR